MRSMKLRVFSLIAISFLTFIFLCFVVFGLYSVFSENVTEGKSFGNFHNYRIQQYNSKNEKISFGFATIRGEIEDGSYFYSDDEGDVNVLISGKGSNEYFCTGTCFCEEEESERKSSSILPSRPITFIVAALSSVIAYNKAKEYFEENCSKRLGDSCSVSSIRSKPDFCERAKDVRDKEYDENEISHEDDVDLWFLCHGICLVGHPWAPGEWEDWDYPCNQLELSAKVTYVSGVKYPTSKDFFTGMAENVFNDQHFDPFCKKHSKKTINGETHSMCAGKTDPRWHRSGYRSEIDERTMIMEIHPVNDFIECEQLNYKERTYFYDALVPPEYDGL